MPKDLVGSVERACTQLAAEGRPVTFAEIAVRAGVSRTTLYRHLDLRALIEDHRLRTKEANTLSGLAVQLDQVRLGLDAVAAKVRGQEERLRKLEKRSASPER